MYYTYKRTYTSYYYNIYGVHFTLRADIVPHAMILLYSDGNRLARDRAESPETGEVFFPVPRHPSTGYVRGGRKRLQQTRRDGRFSGRSWRSVRSETELLSYAPAVFPISKPVVPKPLLLCAPFVSFQKSRTPPRIN